MKPEKKYLIAYFSHSGNTEAAAKMTAELTDGELFRITAAAYPKDYHETTEIAKKELNENARPALTEHISDMDSYDVIILGYPNWWGTMPMAVFTFLEEYDFTRKIIAPLCTNEGSGMGRSENDRKKLCPGVNIIKGLAIRGSQVSEAKDKIAQWLDADVNNDAASALGKK